VTSPAQGHRSRPSDYSASLELRQCCRFRARLTAAPDDEHSPLRELGRHSLSGKRARGCPDPERSPLVHSGSHACPSRDDPSRANGPLRAAVGAHL